MLPVRIHPDDCGEWTGRELPGTHKLGRHSAAQIAQQSPRRTVVYVARARDVLMMRPLLAHALFGCIAGHVSILLDGGSDGRCILKVKKRTRPPDP